MKFKKDVGSEQLSFLGLEPGATVDEIDERASDYVSVTHPEKVPITEPRRRAVAYDLTVRIHDAARIARATAPSKAANENQLDLEPGRPGLKKMSADGEFAYDPANREATIRWFIDCYRGLPEHVRDRWLAILGDDPNVQAIAHRERLADSF